MEINILKYPSECSWSAPKWYLGQSIEGIRLLGAPLVGFNHPLLVNKFWVHKLSLDLDDNTKGDFYDDLQDHQATIPACGIFMLASD